MHHTALHWRLGSNGFDLSAKFILSLSAMLRIDSAKGRSIGFANLRSSTRPLIPSASVMPLVKRKAGSKQCVNLVRKSCVRERSWQAEQRPGVAILLHPASNLLHSNGSRLALHCLQAFAVPLYISLDFDISLDLERTA